MNQLLLYIVALMENHERGELENYPDPGVPADLGEELTQDDIDFIKKLKKEMTERFALL